MVPPRVSLGEVSYVNEPLLYFILNDCICVNCGIYITSNDSINFAMPKVGDKIPFSSYKTHFHSKSIQGKEVHTLCRNNKGINFTRNTPLGRYYTWMIEDCLLREGDLFAITKMHESIKDTVSPEIDAAEAILWCVENKLVRMDHSSLANIPSNKDDGKLSQLNCMTISHCKHVQIQGQNYEKFPYWSYGVHRSIDGQVLIGYLFVHPKLGTICIKDKFDTIGCIIMKQDNHHLDDLINKTIYLERYLIFTEIFNPIAKFNLSYICMNFDDITVVEVKKRKREDSAIRRSTFKIRILAKSYPNFTSSKGYHFWLLVEEVETTYLKTEHKLSIERCFLCFSREFIERLPTLEVGNIHSLEFDKKLRGTYDVEYSRIDSSLSQLQVGNDVVMSKKQDELKKKLDMPYLNENTIDKILQSVGLVSFIAVLKDRKFCQSNGSRTNQSNVPLGFGLLGEKTHILEFCAGNSRTLTMYLNNWERLTMPLGLIPSVIVKVRNVHVQNKRYCKSSPLTTLEMVEYLPKVEFSTASLFDDTDWGQIMPLKMIKDIPNGVVIHTNFKTFTVINLSIRRECKLCSAIATADSTVCKTTEDCNGKIDVSVKFNLELNEGATKVRTICKDLEILSAFLSFEDENNWRVWKKSLWTFGLYYFSRRSKAGFLKTRSNHSQFIRYTNNLLRNHETKVSNKISILCRKMDNSRHSNKEEFLCFGLKSRLVHT